MFLDHIYQQVRSKKWYFYSPFFFFFKKKKTISQIVVLITKSFDAPLIHSTLRLLLGKTSQCSTVHYSGLHIGAKTGSIPPTTALEFHTSSSHPPLPRPHFVLPTSLENVFVVVKSTKIPKSSDLRRKEMLILRNGLNSIMKFSTTTHSRPPVICKG